MVYTSKNILQLSLLAPSSYATLASLYKRRSRGNDRGEQTRESRRSSLGLGDVDDVHVSPVVGARGKGGDGVGGVLRLSILLLRD